MKSHRLPDAKIKRDFLDKIEEVFGRLLPFIPPCTQDINDECNICQLCINIQIWDEQNNPTCIICGELIERPYSKTDYCIACEEVIQYNVMMNRLFNQELTTPEREYLLNNKHLLAKQ